MDIEPFFTEENKLTGSEETFVSLSQRYTVQISVYKTLPKIGSVSRGLITRTSDGTTLFDVHRNYHAFPFCFVEGHPNGHDYLVCGTDYQGQTILELDTGKRADYLPKGAEKGIAFCWAKITASTEKNVLGVEGCFWAAPNDIRFVDFSDPMNLPLLVLTEIHNTGDTAALDKEWSAIKGVQIEHSDPISGKKKTTLWQKPTYAEVERYWSSEVSKIDPRSFFLPDIEEQSKLAKEAVRRAN